MRGILNDWDRCRLYVVTVFAVPLCGMMLVDFFKRVETQRMPLLSGTIVRQLPKKSKWSFRPVVEVKVDNKPFVVHASLIMDSLRSMPRQVTFHFSGDPNEEVHLQEETNPLWGASLFFLIPSVLFFLWDRISAKSKVLPANRQSLQ